MGIMYIEYHHRFNEKKLSRAEVRQVKKKAQEKCKHLKVKGIRITRRLGKDGKLIGFTVFHKEPRYVFSTGLEVNIKEETL